jgi:NAD(P)H-hydrate epimerase
MLLKQLRNFREREKARSRTYIAIDIPTGVSGDTGEVFPSCFQADMTLTIQYRKLGMTQNQAPEQCGSIRLIDGAIRSSQWSSQFRLADSSALSKLPSRSAISHKGTFGHTLILAGCADMPGAGTLAALGAFASGVGKVSQLRFSTSTSNPPPEVIHLSASGQNLSTADLANIVSRMETGSIQSIVLGPGIGTAPETADSVVSLLEAVANKGLPIVLDADALNLIAMYHCGDIKPLLRRAVMTPHVGEAARLLGITSEVVQRDRPATVRRLYEEYGATIMLKGGGSLAYDGKEGRVNLRGTGFLATAGSGDILSGVIGGFLAQGLSTIEAAQLGMYLHGEAAEHIGSRPMRASELARVISEVIGFGVGREE